MQVRATTQLLTYTLVDSLQDEVPLVLQKVCSLNNQTYEVLKLGAMDHACVRNSKGPVSGDSML